MGAGSGEFRPRFGEVCIEATDRGHGRYGGPLGLTSDRPDLLAELGDSGTQPVDELMLFGRLLAVLGFSGIHLLPPSVEDFGVFGGERRQLLPVRAASRACTCSACSRWTAASVVATSSAAVSAAWAAASALARSSTAVSSWSRSCSISAAASARSRRLVGPSPRPALDRLTAAHRPPDVR
ncbi:hypothetical protein [Rhodococcus koreensis]|uniref:hypothetical protein n=1 Tax=Rhodococcus koreensis TaxID=99653 RepID=UPI001428B69E|nr:hypothetical protein [Rhodococcus koreensis]